MKTIFTCLISLLTLLCFGQNNSIDIEKTAKQIKKNISFARSFRYSENPDYNIDSLCLQTAKKTVKLMSGNNFSAAFYKNLGLKLSAESKDKTALKIYNFGYDCGGTRRFITHPILQWKNASGKTFAYNFSSKINCDFYTIYPLKSAGRNLYLLIGTEAGDGSCYQGLAYVVEIKGDHLITDNPIFINRPYLNLCNEEFDFDTKTQVLTGMLQHSTGVSSLKNSLIEQGDYSKNATANTALETLIGKGYYSEPSIFYVKFNGKQFVKHQ